MLETNYYDNNKQLEGVRGANDLILDGQKGEPSEIIFDIINALGDKGTDSMVDLLKEIWEHERIQNWRTGAGPKYKLKGTPV